LPPPGRWWSRSFWRHAHAHGIHTGRPCCRCAAACLLQGTGQRPPLWSTTGSVNVPCIATGLAGGGGGRGSSAVGHTAPGATPTSTWRRRVMLPWGGGRGHLAQRTGGHGRLLALLVAVDAPSRVAEVFARRRRPSPRTRGAAILHVHVDGRCGRRWPRASPHSRRAWRRWTCVTVVWNGSWGPVAVWPSPHASQRTFSQLLSGSAGAAMFAAAQGGMRGGGEARVRVGYGRGRQPRPRTPNTVPSV